MEDSETESVSGLLTTSSRATFSGEVVAVAVSCGIEEDEDTATSFSSVAVAVAVAVVGVVLEGVESVEITQGNSLRMEGCES